MGALYLMLVERMVQTLQRSESNAELVTLLHRRLAGLVHSHPRARIVHDGSVDNGRDEKREVCPTTQPDVAIIP